MEGEELPGAWGCLGGPASAQLSLKQNSAGDSERSPIPASQGSGRLLMLV